jgi:hypothetical protein
VADRCYCGEADVVADRLRYHQRDKAFWDRVVVITSRTRTSPIADLLMRDETQRTGVYLLLGDDESAVGDTPLLR